MHRAFGIVLKQLLRPTVQHREITRRERTILRLDAQGLPIAPRFQNTNEVTGRLTGLTDL